MNMNYFFDILRNKYFLFDGRATRAEYWSYTLTLLGIYILVSVLGGILLPESVMALVTSIIFIGTFIPGLGVSVRRMHDINKSGWWIFITLIPIIGSIWFLILTLQKSWPGPTEYDAPGQAGAQPQDPAMPVQNTPPTHEPVAPVQNTQSMQAEAGQSTPPETPLA